MSNPVVDTPRIKTVENFAKAFGLKIKIERGTSKIVLEALEKGKEKKRL